MLDNLKTRIQDLNNVSAAEGRSPLAEGHEPAPHYCGRPLAAGASPH